MGSHKRELRNLLREYDVSHDEEMVELADEIFELGYEAGEMNSRGGFGQRDEMEDDDFDEEEGMFRRMWNNGGFGERGTQGGGSSSGSGRSGGSSGGGYGNRRGVKGTGRYSRYRR